MNTLNRPKPFGLIRRSVALTLILLLLLESFAPTLTFALTSGPSQPEATQFQPVGVTDMVDVFSGDFGYNIPLLELPGPNGGYPFNLSYQSGTTMDQEASWVGLGWNVNAGSIVRNMRGLPDEFNGSNDAVKRTIDMLPNETYGGGLNINYEFTGADFDKLKSAQSNVGFSIGFKIYENSYKGIGYGVDLGTSFRTGSKDKMNCGVGLNFSIDSQEGVGANTDASMSKGQDAIRKGTLSSYRAGLGLGFHSSGGLNASIRGSISGTYKNGEKTRYRNTGPQASAISFAVASHTPTIGLEMVSKHFTGNLSAGPGVSGNYPYFSASGFYSISKIANKEELLPAYGYLHLQNQDDQKGMSDVNREKDGTIYGTSSNLASPTLTYDFYNINGQGTGGMFRPYRQDYGHVAEQKRKSYGAGGSLGFDIGVMNHAGISGSFNYSESNSGDWENGNDAREYFTFRDKGHQRVATDDDRFEGVYFKMAGGGSAIPVDELAQIGGMGAVRVAQNGHTLQAQLTDKTNSTYYGLDDDNMRREKRMPRSTAIIPYTNAQIVAPGSFNEVLREYDIKILKKPGETFKYADLTPIDYSTLSNSRGKNGGKTIVNPDHLAGITVLQEDGKRYVYALPAYNNSQVQETFSVPAANTPAPVVTYANNGITPKYRHADLGHYTDEYHERVEMPRYAHSYLLTSVLGDDYVDADNEPGPSAGDYGYWVKFNYVKTSDNFPWRNPISGANYYPGEMGSSMDDKGGYTFGKKEIWYLASAETQTHIVIFEMSPRKDGFGPAGEGMTQAANNPALSSGEKLYKLDKIKLYSKADYYSQTGVPAQPLQTVHFDYKYELCPGTPNSTAPGGGKLTLWRVYFTFKYDYSGTLTPYIFEYDQTRNFQYNYLNNKYDRWGTYRSFGMGTAWANQEFPYTPQFDPAKTQDATEKASFKEDRDKDASAWHLTKITLPSGGKINVEYESDDYAYVQHRKAAQMFKVAALKNSPTVSGDKNIVFKDSDNYWGNGPGIDDEDSQEARRVYFRLEDPIPSGISESERRKMLIEKYLDCLYDHEKQTYTRPLYAKLKMQLRGSIWEYISGYYPVELSSADNKPVCGTAGESASAFHYGYVVLDFFEVNKKAVRHHPFAVNAWQHLRTNLPRVLTASGDFQSGANNSDMEHLTRMGSMASWTNTIKSMFTGYRKYCFDNEFGNKVDLSESYIRLDSPDGFKYGGGSRVKKIYVQDDPVWGSDKMGQVYDYTMDNGRDGKISSGVATYEPMPGGEETSLRTAKFYDQHLPFHTDNNLFFEYPVNESYYPAPRVGYAKVTVSSLNTWEVQQKIAGGADPDTYRGIQTTGKTEHEFFTAREFPTITEETILKRQGGGARSMKYDPYMIPLPFIGMLSFSELSASQGYSIRLNDMHGKQKSITTYASKKSGGFEDVPLTRVIYEYNTLPYVYEGYNVLQLNNEVDVLQDDPQMRGLDNAYATGMHKAKTQKMLIGLEYDFFADFRQATTEAGTGGLSFNIDIMGTGAIGIPLPFPWPSINYSKERTRLAVLNKVIHQAGIIKRVYATDGQSTVQTENLVFDKYSGAPLLTTMNNNYDNQIFNYEYPAYMAYTGTDAAYQNVLMEFSAGIMNYTAETANGAWSINPNDLTIGNQPGIGNKDRPDMPNSNNAITYNELYNYLEEGDEFIVETYDPTTGKPNNKRLAVLFEKRTGVSYTDCMNMPVLLFQFPYVPFNGMEFRNMQRARFLLVRSGKRNLLDMKVGAIKSLDNGSGAATQIEHSPLHARAKVTSATTTVPELYDQLTAELAGFVNHLLDCNGRLTPGQYYLDAPRFLNTDGTLMFPGLFGLLRSIRIDDNCGGKQACSAYEQHTTHYDEGYYTYCNCYTKPADVYDQPVCIAPTAAPTQSEINAYVAQFAPGTPPATIVSAWNGSHDCHKMRYIAAGTDTTSVCVQSCLDCYANLGRDENNTIIRPGYHIVLAFRPPFKGPDNSNCYTSHCLAKAKYLSGLTVNRTNITRAEKVATGKIRFHYSDLNGSSGTTDFCMQDMEFGYSQTNYKVKNVLATSAVELTPYKLNAGLYENICDANNNTSYLAPRNLYSKGFKGIWRAAKTYYYADERYQGQKPSTSAHMTSMLNTETDGVFDGNDNDKYFYLFNWDSYLDKKIHPQWLPNEVVTAFNRHSQSAEARDVLGIYSSVMFDSDGKMPVAVGRNMKLKEMFYEGFDNTANIVFNGDQPALAIPATDGGGIAMNHPNRVEVLHGVSFSGARCLSIKSTAQYIIGRSQLQLEPGKKYMLSMWVGGYNTLYSPAEVDARFGHLMNVKLYFMDKDGAPISIPGVGGYINFKAKGLIFEGKGTFWRRLEGTFTPPANTHTIKLEFGTTGYSSTGPSQLYGSMYQMVSSNGSVFIDQRACYDDIRIFPAEGLMKNYVYDMGDYKLLAEGDENNFPTLYGYSASGALMVVKKLTEQGIKTLKEIRSNTKRTYSPDILEPQLPTE